MDETNKQHGKRGKNSEKHASQRVANAAGTLDTKELGDLGELAFVLAASSKGLAVSKPYGDCRRYGLIVDSGRRLLRVQVKSAYTAASGRYYAIRCSHSFQGARICYTATEIDFLAAYIAPRDIWYLIPVGAVVARVSVHLHPDGPRRHNKEDAIYEIYREAWEQLEERTT